VRTFAGALAFRAVLAVSVTIVCISVPSSARVVTIRFRSALPVLEKYVPADKYPPDYQPGDKKYPPDYPPVDKYPPPDYLPDDKYPPADKYPPPDYPPTDKYPPPGYDSKPPGYDYGPSYSEYESGPSYGQYDGHGGSYGSGIKKDALLARLNDKLRNGIMLSTDKMMRSLFEWAESKKCYSSLFIRLLICVLSKLICLLVCCLFVCFLLLSPSVRSFCVFF